MHVAFGAVFLEQGGGTLVVIKIASLHLPSIVNLCPLDSSLYFAFMSDRSGLRMPPGEKSALYTYIIACTVST